MKPIAKIALTLATLAITCASTHPVEAAARSRQPDRQHGRQVQERHARQRAHAPTRKRVERGEHARARHQVQQRRSHVRSHQRSAGYERHHVTRNRHLSRHRSFVIPRQIYSQHRRHFGSYYERDFYFAPHRHHHAVYLFPYRSDYGWDYREYAYCEGELFRDHGRISYQGRRLSVELGY